MGSTLDNIKFITQPTIKVEGGNVMKIMKISDYKEFSFNEAYFSSIDFNYTKGWKMQLKMNSNLCVPIGEVKFTFVTKDFKDHKTYIIGENNYGILSIPPKIWYSFKGLSEKTSLILNISDSEHDEKDIKKINLEEFPLKLKL
jgi:dTDP-4-dehydrorhamnose 3,5-epimerase